jgi:hypothetical protein
MVGTMIPNFEGHESLAGYPNRGFAIVIWVILVLAKKKWGGLKITWNRRFVPPTHLLSFFVRFRIQLFRG